MKKLLYTGIIRDKKKLEQFFKKDGFQLLHFPLIEILPQMIQEEKYQEEAWIFFTSQEAIPLFSISFLRKKKIAVIGEKTGHALQKRGIGIDFQPMLATRECLVREFVNAFQPTSIFYPKSNLSDTWLEKELCSNRFQVSTCLAYENHLPQRAENDFVRFVLSEKIETFFFSSPSTWLRFKELMEKEGVSYEKFCFFSQGNTTRKLILSDGGSLGSLERIF